MSAIETSHRSTVKVGREDDLTAEMVADWATQLPDNAKVTAIMLEVGDQRDPAQKLIGLAAAWDDTTTLP
jgi:hypothetical protein